LVADRRLQAFFQAFPNFACFAPSFSKDFFGRFVRFQGVTIDPNPKGPFPNFLAAAASSLWLARAAKSVELVERT
jgi:hypothetical protein